MYKFSVYMFSIYWHMIHCLCLYSIITPWCWLP